MLDKRKPGQVADITISPFANEFVDNLKLKGSNQKFVPLRSETIELLDTLTKSEIRVLLIVMWSAVNGKYGDDKVYLTTQVVDDWRSSTGKPFSRRTFEDGRKGLAAKEIIHKCNMRGFWWINPSFVFCGDARGLINKYRDKSLGIVKEA